MADETPLANPGKAAEAAASEAAKTTKWYNINPKNREWHLGEGAGKKTLHIVGGVVGLGAIWCGLKHIARGTGISKKTDEQGNEVPAGIGTLILGVGELAGGALLTINMVSRGKGAGRGA